MHAHHQARRVAEARRQREAAPARHVRHLVDHAGARVERPGRGDTDPPGGPVGARCQLRGQPDDRGDDGIRPAGRRGGDPPPVQHGPVARHARGAQVRAAEVDRQRVRG